MVQPLNDAFKITDEHAVYRIRCAFGSEAEQISVIMLEQPSCELQTQARLIERDFSPPEVSSQGTITKEIESENSVDRGGRGQGVRDDSEVQAFLP